MTRTVAVVALTLMALIDAVLLAADASWPQTVAALVCAGCSILAGALALTHPTRGEP